MHTVNYNHMSQVVHSRTSYQNQNCTRVLGDPRISDVGCPVTALELDLHLCFRNPKIFDAECPVTALELDLQLYSRDPKILDAGCPVTELEPELYLCSGDPIVSGDQHRFLAELLLLTRLSSRALCRSESCLLIQNLKKLSFEFQMTLPLSNHRVPFIIKEHLPKSI